VRTRDRRSSIGVPAPMVRSGSPRRFPRSSAMGSGDRRRSPSNRTIGASIPSASIRRSVWSTGGLTRFDPKTGKFHAHYGSAVGLRIAIDKQDTIWFTEMTGPARSARSIQDLEGEPSNIPPSRDRPRRIQVAEDGHGPGSRCSTTARSRRFDRRPRLQGISAAARPRAALCALASLLDRSLLVLSEARDLIGQARSDTGQGHRISDALYRQRHARLLPRIGWPHVVRHAAEQQDRLFSMCLTGSVARSFADVAPACRMGRAITRASCAVIAKPITRSAGR